MQFLLNWKANRCLVPAFNVTLIPTIKHKNISTFSHTILLKIVDNFLGALRIMPFDV